jgi:hypothetical protein
VWPVLVVVGAVDAEHVLEVATAEDEDLVEAISAECAHPALGVGVRVRRLDGCVDHPDGLSPEDRLEGVAQLRVAIVDENRNGSSSPNRMIRLRACWPTQPPSGVTCRRRTRSVASRAR